MNATVTALRAITAMYFRRLLKIIIIFVAITVVFLLLLVVYLATTLSDWWWLLLAPIGLMVAIAAVIGAGLWILTDKLLPRDMTTQESRQIKNFTDKLFGLVEQTRLPYPVILVLTGKDILRVRESTMLRDVIDDSSSLKDDFTSIKEMFS